MPKIWLSLMVLGVMSALPAWAESFKITGNDTKTVSSAMVLGEAYDHSRVVLAKDGKVGELRLFGQSQLVLSGGTVHTLKIEDANSFTLSDTLCPGDFCSLVAMGTSTITVGAADPRLFSMLTIQARDRATLKVSNFWSNEAINLEESVHATLDHASPRSLAVGIGTQADWNGGGIESISSAGTLNIGPGSNCQWLNSTGTLNMTGGSLGPQSYVQGTFRASGGSIVALQVQDGETELTGDVNVTNLTPMGGHTRVSGGMVGSIYAKKTGAVVITGGVVQVLSVMDTGTIDMQGGHGISSLAASDHGVIQIHGKQFNYPFGEIGDEKGLLTGTLSDGQAVSAYFMRMAKPAANRSRTAPESKIILIQDGGSRR